MPLGGSVLVAMRPALYYMLEETPYSKHKTAQLFARTIATSCYLNLPADGPVTVANGFAVTFEFACMVIHTSWFAPKVDIDTHKGIYK